MYTQVLIYRTTSFIITLCSSKCDIIKDTAKNLGMDICNKFAITSFDFSRVHVHLRHLLFQLRQLKF